MPPIVVNPRQAAEMIGCTRNHIYTLVSRGQLRSTKVGKLVRIPVADIYRLVGLDEDSPAGGDS